LNYSSRSSSANNLTNFLIESFLPTTVQYMTFNAKIQRLLKSYTLSVAWMRNLQYDTSSLLPPCQLHILVRQNKRQYPEFTSVIDGIEYRANKILRKDVSDHFMLTYDKWHVSLLRNFIV
jgi:hypothetical protein